MSMLVPTTTPDSPRGTTGDLVPTPRPAWMVDTSRSSIDATVVSASFEENGDAAASSGSIPIRRRFIRADLAPSPSSPRGAQGCGHIVTWPLPRDRDESAMHSAQVGSGGGFAWHLNPRGCPVAVTSLMLARRDSRNRIFDGNLIGWYSRGATVLNGPSLEFRNREPPEVATQ